MAVKILSGCGGTSGYSGGGGSSSSDDLSRYFDSSLSSGTLSFEVSPAATSEVVYIIPLGNLNPSGHTTPSDHIYFYHTAEVSVIAPAAGKVLEVQTTTSGSKTEHSMIVGVTATSSYYFHHIVLSPVLSKGDTITVGQALGHSSSLAAAFDLGVVNYNVKQPYVNTKRYISSSLYGDSPLKYFKEPVKTQLYSMVNRSGSDKDGKFCYDLAGKLIGNWFMDSLPNDSTSSGVDAGTLEAAFVYDVTDPTQIKVSIGGTIFTTGHYFVQNGADDPVNVTTANGKIIYKLYADSTKASPQGLLAVQMLTDDKIKAEATTEVSSGTMSFTSNAKTYVR